MSMAWPISFGMAGIARSLIPWFLGNDYLPAATAMVILSPIIVAIAASSLSANQYLLATNQTGCMTVSYSASAILNLAVNAFLIPEFGFVGAAVGTIAAEYSVFLIQYYMMNRRTLIISTFVRCLKYALYSAIMYMIIATLGRKLEATIVTTCVQILVGMGVYLFFLLITKDSFFIFTIKKILRRG